MILRPFKSEWIKLRRRRLWYGSYGAIAGVVVMTTVVRIAGATHRVGSSGNLTLTQLARAGGLAQGVTGSTILLGAVSLSIAAAQFGGEFAHGTLRNLLVREPRRARLIVGNGLAILSFIVGAVAAATVVDIGAAFVMAHARGVTTAAWTSGTGMGDLGIAVGDMAIAVCGFAIVGMILGILLKSSVIAIATGLAVLLPVETIFTDAVPETARWLPGHLLEAVAQGGTSVAGFAAALVTVSAYLAGAVAVTLVVFARRDVTS
ncbi:MAG: hypothetical protein ACYCTL_03665 [Acidimicrobiales bacterium]